MTAQAADTTLTLACQGTTTTKIGGGPPKQEPISMGVIVNFTDRTVNAAFGYHNETGQQWLMPKKSLTKKS